MSIVTGSSSEYGEQTLGVVIKKETEKSGIEKLIDAKVERLLVDYARKINEGNNGIIFLVNTSEIAKEDLETLKQYGINLETEQVIKILKLYQPGVGKKEFEMQQAAHSAIKNDSRTEAIIPNPVAFRDLQLSEEGIASLGHHKLSLPEGRAEIILMDFIPGEDLATILFKEALQRANPEEYPNLDALKGRTVDSMIAEVAGKIGYKKPGKKGTEGERAFEQRKIESENEARLVEYLFNKNLVLDPSILERIKQTVAKLHRVGIAHRDLHARNIMIAGDYKRGGTSTVYIIDFGSADFFTGSHDLNMDEIYAIGNETRPQDEAVIRVFEPLSKSKQERAGELRKDDEKQLQEEIEKVRRVSKLSEKRDKWVEEMRTRENLTTALDFCYRKIMTEQTKQESQINDLLDLLLMLIQEADPEKKPNVIKQVQDFIDKKIQTDSSLRRPVKNRMSVFERLIQSI